MSLDAAWAPGPHNPGRAAWLASKQQNEEAWRARRRARAEARDALRARMVERMRRGVVEPGRLSNTAPPKYDAPPVACFPGVQPEQVDWLELAKAEGWKSGAEPGRLAVGCDWLTFYGWGGELREDAAALLARSRAHVDEQGPCVVRIGGHDYAMQGRGATPCFRWQVQGPSATLAFRAPNPDRTPTSKDMTVKVELRAVTLWRFGAELAVAIWKEAVRGMFKRPPERWTVSRIDLAVDVATDRIPEDAALVGRASFEQFASGEGDSAWVASIYGHGRACTGWRWGTGDVVVRCYRKDIEIAKRRKWWVREMWGGHEGEVWRVEVQLRGDVLRELVTDGGAMKGADPGTWLARARAVWSHFVGGRGAWASARVRGATDTNRSRWGVHPWWERFAGATWGRESMPRAERRPRHVPSRVRAVRKWHVPEGLTPRTAVDIVSKRHQDDAIARASLPDAVSRDLSSAVGWLARVKALAGDSGIADVMARLDDDAVARAVDRVVFGRALDSLAAKIGPKQGGGRAYQLSSA